MKKINILIISALLFSSCEKTLNVKVKDIGRRTVVNSIFTSNEPISVNLSESMHIQDEATGFKPITDATITLFEGDSQVESLTGGETDGFYFFSHTPLPGKVYKIMVTTNNHGTVTAQSTIPSVVKISKLEYEISNELDQLFMGNIEFKLSIEDNAGEANYYQLKAFVRQTVSYYNPELDEYVPSTDEYKVMLESSDPSIQVADYAIGGLLLGDDLFDGERHTISFGGDFYFAHGEIENLTEVTYFIELHSLSKDLYNYYLSYTKYQETGGDPFVEPVSVYNNIENGFGIFGGASMAKDSLEIDLDGLF